jgi:hypothetical protein
LTLLGELAALWMLDSASNTKKTRMRASTWMSSHLAGSSQKGIVGRIKNVQTGSSIQTHLWAVQNLKTTIIICCMPWKLPQVGLKLVNLTTWTNQPLWNISLQIETQPTCM